MKRKIYSQQKIKELDEIELKLKRYNENLAQKLNVQPPKISNELIAENHEYRAYLLIDSCNSLFQKTVLLVSNFYSEYYQLFFGFLQTVHHHLPSRQNSFFLQKRKVNGKNYMLFLLHKKEK